MSYLYPDLCIVCEGEQDRVILAELTSRVLRYHSIGRRVQILVANGKLVIPRLVQAAAVHFSPDSLVVVVDSDGRPRVTRKMLERSFGGSGYWIVIAHPNLESWVISGRFRELSLEYLRAAAANADLSAIETQHPEFRVFRDAVTSLPRSR